MKKVRVESLGKEFIPTLLVVKKRRIKAKGREYWAYSIYLPKEVGEQLESEAGDKYNTIPVLALIRPAEWYHMLDWRSADEAMKALVPDEIKHELKVLGFWGDEGA